MLGDHLDEMVRNRVRLVVIALRMISVFVPCIVSSTIRDRKMKIGVVRFRQKMNVNAIDLNDEEQCRQYTQPPTRRGGFYRLGAPGFPCANQI